MKKFTYLFLVFILLSVFSKAQNCEANFSFQYEQSENDISFVDLSASDSPIASWIWNFGDSTTIATQNPIHFFPNGIFEVCLTIFTSDSCSSTYCDTVIIQQVYNPCDSFEISAQVTSETLTSSNGAIDITVVGAIDSVTYLWNNGETTEDLTGLSAGSYTVVVASGDCNLTETFTVVSEIPCQAFSINIGNVNDTIFVCQNAPVVFDAVSDYANNNANYQQTDATTRFAWHFGDGSQTESGFGLTNVTHTFAEGIHTIFVQATDANSCTNSDLAQRIIAILPSPSFQGTSCVSSACPVELVNLSGEVTPNDLSIPIHLQTEVSGTTFLPDGSGVSYTSSLTFSEFGIAQTLAAGNLLSICANMEHSYLGDLDIVLTCPNGNSIMIKNHSIGGGGTYLGEPIDDDSDLNPGIGYDYCWTQNASETMSVASSSNTTLPAGEYAVEDTWNTFVGCPLNGNWTMTVTDNMAIDNGYIFSWSLNFDESILPTSTVLSNTFDVANSYWTGENIVSQTNGIGTAEPTSANPEYTFHVTDNLGCEFDTTLHISIDGINANFSYDIDTTNNSVSFYDLSSAPQIIEWSWNLGDGTTSDWQNLIHVFNNGTYNVCLTITTINGCSSTYCTSITIGENIIEECNIWANGNTTSVSAIGANDGAINITVFGSYGANSYYWSNGATTQNIENLAEGNYTVEIHNETCYTASTFHVGVIGDDIGNWDLLTAADVDTCFTFVIADAYISNYVYDSTFVTATWIITGEGQMASITQVYEYNTTGYNDVEITINCDGAKSMTTYEGRIFIDENIILSIDNEEAVNGVVLFPNPVNNILNLSIDANKSESINVEIFNITGQIINTTNFNTQQGNNNFQIDASDLSNGIYFIKIGDSKIQKFVK